VEGRAWNSSWFRKGRLGSNRRARTPSPNNPGGRSFCGFSRQFPASKVTIKAVNAHVAVAPSVDVINGDQQIAGTRKNIEGLEAFSVLNIVE
jgi:hypothetical protein